mgnify:FL=1
MSRKNRDKYNRFRSKTIAFRVSEEENKTLETKVTLSGLTKQDYLIHCIEQRDYVIDGKNTRVWKALKQQLDVFIKRFCEIDDISKLENDELEVLEYMLQIIIAIKKEAQIKVEMEPRQ